MTLNPDRLVLKFFEVVSRPIYKYLNFNQYQLAFFFLHIYIVSMGFLMVLRPRDGMAYFYSYPVMLFFLSEMIGAAKRPIGMPNPLASDNWIRVMRLIVLIGMIMLIIGDRVLAGVITPLLSALYIGSCDPTPATETK